MSNSKKTLLSESQVRQFMKLAKLTPLTPGFVQGLTERTAQDLEERGMPAYRDEDEDIREMRHAKDDDIDEGHGRGANELNKSPGPHRGGGRAVDNLYEGEHEEAELHATEDELGHEDKIADEEADELDAMADGGDQMISVGDLLSALESALEDVTGQPVEASVEDEVEADVELDAADDVEDVDLDVDLEERQKYGGNKGDERRSDRDYMDEGAHEDDELDERQKYGGNKGDEMRSKRDYMEEEKKQGADDREDEHLGAKDGKESGKKQSMKDRRKEMRGARRAAGKAGDPVPTQESVNATDELVEQITKRVAARILKSALTKK